MKSLIILLIACSWAFSPPDTAPGQAATNANKPKKILTYSASGDLTATRNYGYDSLNRIVRIEDIPADGLRKTFSDIRYNGSGKPVYVETFYSGITNDAEGITYFRNIRYSGNRVSSIEQTSTSGDPETTTFTYYSETRTYEAVYPHPPVLLFQFNSDLNLKRHYTAEGLPMFDITYSTDPGLFVYASVPMELSLLFDSGRHFFFSKNEVTSLPVFNGNSYDIDSFRDEYDRIVTIQARTPGTENIVFRVEVSY